jgi:calcineurin-like phosphoesterase family protein
MMRLGMWRRLSASWKVNGEDCGMRRWIISDTHFGHSNIQKHCRRPADVDAQMVANWQRLVEPDDLVYHLGDFYFTSGSGRTLDEWVALLPGRKILVLGNHDSKTVSAYINAGFAFCCDEFVSGGILFTHTPRAYLPAGVQLNVHGHMHNSVDYRHRAYPHCRLFTLEYEDYSPRILDKWLREQAREGVLPRRERAVIRELSEQL